MHLTDTPDMPWKVRRHITRHARNQRIQLTIGNDLQFGMRPEEAMRLADALVDAAESITTDHEEERAA